MRLSRPVLVPLLATVAHAPLLAQGAASAAAAPAQSAPAPAPAPTPATPEAEAAPAPLPKAAQVQPDDSGVNEEEEEPEIVVTGQRERGAVIGDIPPEVQLDARDIRALGAGSIAEVLEAISPQTRSGRGRGGRPVVLVNGRRISGFQEIRNIPPEAIQRIDILPEEVALKYGYRADQRVVNFVLRRRFRAVTTEAEYGLATEGGRSSYQADVNLLRIDRAGRWELDLEYEHQAPLLESERDLDTEFGEFRTLLPESDRVALAGTLNRTIFNDVSATMNATLEGNDSESLLGLPVPNAPRPLTRESESRNGRLAIALNGTIEPWRWSFTGAYDRSRSVSNTDRRDVLDLSDRAETRSEIANAELVMIGSLLDLPAGDLSSTFRGGIERLGLASESSRGDTLLTSDLSRTRGNVQANIDVPIASRRNDVLAAVGNLSANFNAEVEELSDFGTLRTIGYGINWSPIAQASLIASVTDEEGAPGIQQLGNAVIQTPNVRVFDFTRRETVDVTRIEGGNPSLRADNRRVLKLGLNLRPFEETDFSLTADYTNTRTRNSIASFPAVTPEIEAAFPERFQRDAEGRLFRVDVRPVNFERTNREELRWGINFSKPIESARPPREAFPQRFRQRAGQGGGGPGGAAAPGRGGGSAPQGAGGAASGQVGAGQGAGGEGARGGGAMSEGGFGGRATGQGGFGGNRGMGRGGFGGGRFGGGGLGGRLQFALYHTWRLKDELLIREGVPELDFLGGSAAGGGGGRPRHELEGQAGIFKNGFGARLTANWQSGTSVSGVVRGGGNSNSDLSFSSFAKVNLRLFANLGEQALVGRNPWLRGTRISLSVDNLFNARPEVTDAAGLTPLGYRPDEIDPLGRTVKLSIRKLFF